MNIPHGKSRITAFPPRNGNIVPCVIYGILIINLVANSYSFSLLNDVGQTPFSLKMFIGAELKAHSLMLARVLILIVLNGRTKNAHEVNC